MLMIFSAVNGMKYISVNIRIAPSELAVSPNNQYIAIAGASLDALVQNG